MQFRSYSLVTIVEVPYSRPCKILCVTPSGNMICASIPSDGGSGARAGETDGCRHRNPTSDKFAKRPAKLKVSIDTTKASGPTDVVVDSTGLKVYGEAVWKSASTAWAGVALGEVTIVSADYLSALFPSPHSASCSL